MDQEGAAATPEPRQPPHEEEEKKKDEPELEVSVPLPTWFNPQQLKTDGLGRRNGTKCEIKTGRKNGRNGGGMNNLARMEYSVAIKGTAEAIEKTKKQLMQQIEEKDARSIKDKLIVLPKGVSLANYVHFVEAAGMTSKNKRKYKLLCRPRNEIPQYVEREDEAIKFVASEMRGLHRFFAKTYPLICFDETETLTSRLLIIVRRLSQQGYGMKLKATLGKLLFGSNYEKTLPLDDYLSVSRLIRFSVGQKQHLSTLFRNYHDPLTIQLLMQYLTMKKFVNVKEKYTCALHVEDSSTGKGLKLRASFPEYGRYGLLKYTLDKIASESVSPLVVDFTNFWSTLDVRIKLQAYSRENNDDHLSVLNQQLSIDRTTGWFVLGRNADESGAEEQYKILWQRLKKGIVMRGNYGGENLQFTLDEVLENGKEPESGRHYELSLNFLDLEEDSGDFGYSFNRAKAKRIFHICSTLCEEISSFVMNNLPQSQ